MGQYDGMIKDCSDQMFIKTFDQWGDFRNLICITDVVFDEILKQFLFMLVRCCNTKYDKLGLYWTHDFTYFSCNLNYVAVTRIKNIVSNKRFSACFTIYI